jgi:hypothetical protein
MDTIQISQLEDILGIAWEGQKETFIFRGVTTTDYELIPKVGRESSRTGDLKYTRDAELRALERFKRAARPMLSNEPRTEFEWMVVAQHHGVPTRLLDWTLSPLVAAYFAVRPGVTENVPPRAIYGVPIPKESLGLAAPTRLDNDVFLIIPDQTSPRVTVQQSLFTQHVQPTIAWNPEKLIKWEIPPRLTLAFKMVLDTCGFNEASLFPDLDGIARHIEWQYWRDR